MNFEIGLQLFSVRQALQQDCPATLKEISKIGYKNLELFIHNADNGVRFCGLNAKELKKVLDDSNLQIVSSHVGILDTVDWNDLIEYNLEIGSKTIINPMELFADLDAVYAFCDKMNRYGERARENGLDFYYHNHFETFQRFNGQYMMDILLERTDRDLVKIEFDTYWALRGGVDPIEWLGKLGSRCDLVHQKDIPAAVKPVNVFETIDESEPITFERFMPFSKKEYFAEIGEGSMNIRGIVDEINRNGAAKYLFVEQDHTVRDELESVAISYRNITNLLASMEG
ncbi:sugar phosphate isomerase/epimerase family protein [Cohnella candidum]|uniref:Sugar phosphate isomerase/epimerase n=1 Tax=Cohnella candidum TaxID=2674991 RepID=A0A3G3K6B6_9BACL|nr:sugar phosphate isomerase/epimerase [Cohnella candidum]AYQ75309.1 sugar phosphate isomerase/epimerase [Cohnella candidum]